MHLPHPLVDEDIYTLKSKNHFSKNFKNYFQSNISKHRHKWHLRKSKIKNYFQIIKKIFSKSPHQNKLKISGI